MRRQLGIPFVVACCFCLGIEVVDAHPLFYGMKARPSPLWDEGVRTLYAIYFVKVLASIIIGWLTKISPMFHVWLEFLT